MDKIILLKKSKRQMSLTIISSVCGDIGSSIFSFGLSFMLLSKTGSLFSFAISSIISPILGLILLPIIGPVIDSFSKKKIIVISQILTLMSLTLFWILLYSFGENLLLPTVILITILRISDQFTMTARQAAASSLVYEKELEKLSANIQVTNSVGTIVSSIFGVIIYSSLPFYIFILLEIFAELLTVVITWKLDFNFNEYGTGSSYRSLGNNALSEQKKLFIEGIEYIKRQKYLLFGMLITISINFISGIFSIGIPFIIFKIFDLKNYHFAIGEALNGMGIFIGAIIINKRNKTKYPLLNLWRTSLGIGVILILISLSLHLNLNYGIIALYLLLFTLGILLVLLNAPYVAWVQKNISKEFQGRVFSVLSTMGLATAPLGILFFGWLFNQNINSNIFTATLIFILSGSFLIISNCLSLKYARLNLKEAKIID
ncbi:MFS transporter [Lactococcus sp. dk322]|uniref:MFS transporter n=1 Tax=Lactococcus sp. dk322 TaxID=2603290 RepID=UPI0011C8A1E9|nr:MFS transporter [Lactococcus sp. dk322]TXK47389.1 MFS transporter [Lactococcus sp. dk322]